VIVTPPAGIEFEVGQRNLITVRGANKEQVGQIAAEIRSLRPPEPYKGAGIAYANETIRRKVGKAGV
jgi:large subunit ribosomal protein L6